MYQNYSPNQLLFAGKASDIKMALNSIKNTAEKNETLPQYLLQRPKMSILLRVK